MNVDPAVNAGVCAVTGRACLASELKPLSSLRPNLADVLQRAHPELQPESMMSTEAINQAREDYVRELLETQLGELTHLEEAVVESMRKHELLAEHPEMVKENLTIGQRLSDQIASFGGSWAFILLFGGVLAIWILMNAASGGRAFDPYPFILLNLILSTIAALQAPVIMMSQNRQEHRDRIQAENDYKINLKAELEIRHLHEKMDYLLQKNSERMMEIQQIQLELMKEIARGRQSGAS